MNCTTCNTPAPAHELPGGLCVKCWQEKAEKLEAFCSEQEKRDSEIMSDAIDHSVNAPWMRCSPNLGDYIGELEIQLGSWERAANMLREGMGLDASQTDLRECLLTFNAVKAALETLRVEHNAALEKLDRYATEYPSICSVCSQEMQRCLICEQAGSHKEGCKGTSPYAELQDAHNKLMERCEKAEARIDMMKDEFERIKAIEDDDEVIELCNRAISLICANVPLIEQRDNWEQRARKAEAECHDKNEALKKLAGYAATVRLDRRKNVDGDIMCLQMEDWCDGLLQYAAEAEHSISPTRKE